MKKTILLLLVILTLSFTTYAQYTKLWEKTVNDYTWFQNDNSTRGLAYDEANNYLFVTSRTGGHNIYVLNASTGSVIDTLDMTGVSGGTYNLNLVKVAQDGVIFGINLALAGANYKVYRWANKDAVPTVAYDGSGSGRSGDAFTVVGSGVNTIIYVSGSTNPVIDVLKSTDGITFTVSGQVLAPSAGNAGGSICPTNNTATAQFWVNCSGFPIVHMDNFGNPIDTVSTGIASSGWRNLLYFQKGTEKFVLTSGKNEPTDGKKALFLCVTKSEKFPAQLPPMELTNAYNANANATSDLAYKDNGDGTVTIFQLVTNNGIAAWKTNGIVNFAVDMRDKMISGDFNKTTDTVYVRGVFNSWGTANPMADGDGDSIYTAMVSIGSLGAKEFKFMYRKTATSTDVWEPDPNRNETFSVFYTSFNGGKFGSNVQSDVIGWCNLQHPPTISINQGDSANVYAQVWSNNITPAPGASGRIKAWFGYSSVNNNPANANWTWLPAEYSSQSGNNDEYKLVIGKTLTAGTYYYASRFQLDAQAYKYGGYSSGGGGFWDSTTYKSGVMTIAASANLSGNYYVGAAGTGPGGSNPHFASLKAAVDSLNNGIISGNCTFFITSNITEPCTGGVGVGLAINPGQYTVTFKPYTGIQPVITFEYPTDGNSGPSGSFIIGIPGKGNISWDSLRVTKNIIIDGSNTANGTTRDLTLQTSTTAHRNGMPLVVVGDVSNLVVKNTNIFYKVRTVSTSGNLFIGGIMIRSRNYLSTDWVPRNLTFENNYISANFDSVAQNAQAYGCYQSGTPIPTDYPYNITLKNNKFEGKRRGVALYKAGSHNVFNNEIILNQDIAANTTNEAIIFSDIDSGSVFNVYNNKISKIYSITTAASNGNTAISIEGQGTYNIYNNMIYGFDLNAANPAGYVRGIKNSFASAVLNCNFNSIYMNELPSIGTGTLTYQGILVSDGTNNVKNNIVVSAESDFASYCIAKTGTLGTIISNNNNFYAINGTNGNVGFWNTAATKTLAEWQTASSQDGNSINVTAPFVASNDLHIVANSVTYLKGGATPIPGITTDFDGNTRHSTTPDIGADEFTGTRPGPVSVDTVMFAVNSQWNMLSVPLVATNMAKTALFPNASSQAFWFNNGYVSEDTLSKGKSYWLKFDNSANVTIIGSKNNNLNIPVTTGWNFIGALHKNVTVSSVSSTPSGLIISPFFGFNNYYYQANSIEKGKGYWVKVSGNGTLNLTTTVVKDNPVYAETVESSSSIINIKDAEDRTFDLYLTKKFENNKFELPPAPPSGVFDVRFSTNKYVEQDGKSQIINLASAKYPVTVTLRNGNSTYQVKDLSNGIYLNTLLKGGQSITINNPSINSFSVSSIDIPLNFELMQNYPNPFNPTTNIRYTIAENTNVLLEAYNSLGEKVKTLVNIQQDAGYYTIEFNGKDFASGIYYFKLNAGNYQKIIKAMLVK